VQEVRRDDDNELCGFVVAVDGTWRAITVFGGVLGEHDDEDEACRQVLNDGLASVAERWTLVDRHPHHASPQTEQQEAEPQEAALHATEQIVCIQQMSPDEVTLALDYYSLPGVPTMTIATRDLVDGRWRLERRC
jgi:hypothetical protein